MSLRSPVLAAALLLSACSALATSSASVQLTGVRLQLFDLDPSDGVSPSISFIGGASRGEASITFSAPGSGGNESANFTGLAGAWSPGTTMVSGPFASASSTLGGPGSATGSSLSVSGTATAPGGGFCVAGAPPFNQCFTAFSSFNAQLVPNTQGTFLLSANTLAVLSVEVSMNVSASGGGIIDEFTQFPSPRFDGASANVSLSFTGQGPAGSGQQSSGDGRNLFANAFYDSTTGLFTPNSSSFTGAMSVSFSNLSPADLSGFFSMQIGVNGNAFGDARLVPEPATWGLMLAGLLAVGAITRRARTI